VYRSTDGGQSWTLSGNELRAYRLVTLAISPDYARDRTLLTAGETADGGFVSFRSTDGGAHWTPFGEGLPDPAVWWWAFSPNFATDRTIFAGTSARGVFLSTNSGASWSPLGAGLQGQQQSIWMLAASPDYARDRMVVAATMAGGWRYMPRAVYLPAIVRGAQGRGLAAQATRQASLALRKGAASLSKQGRASGVGR
jgi:hypothetical protein